MTAGTTLRETEIRPEHLMSEQARRYAADVRRLLEHRLEFVEVACPACDRSPNPEVFTKFDLSYRLCGGCETIYVSPRPTPALLNHYYASSENYAYWNEHVFPASETARREKIFRPRAERVAQICDAQKVPRGTLLEVGAGFGTFCEEMRRLKRFTRLLAVEPTPDLASTCRKRGLEVIEARVEDIDPKQLHIDVVASFEVIEHLFAPTEFVSACHHALPPGGLIILTCPNGKGFEVATLRELSSTVDTEHLNYFNPRSLGSLLERHGFEILEVSTPGKLDAELVRTKVLSGDLALDAQPFLQQVLVNDWEHLGAPFQMFLAEHGLSSHMWIVGRKR
jgi:2-polyprenyl-3-methyl-5-hydroxy-6-metoxy-1,4-benzoquinol methylase